MRPILIPLQDLSQTAKNHIGCLIFIFSQEYGGLMKVVLKIFQHHSIVVSRVLREAFNWAPIMSDGSDTSVSDGLFFFPVCQDWIRSTQYEVMRWNKFSKWNLASLIQFPRRMLTILVLPHYKTTVESMTAYKAFRHVETLYQAGLRLVGGRQTNLVIS